jgi:GST-like protein
LGWHYKVVPVNIGKGEQLRPEFLEISPNNKIPAIVDDDSVHGPIAIFESGAILTYLAEKSGRFLAPQGPARYAALEWLHWQTANLGPVLGQLGFFAVRSEEKAPLAIQRFTEEAGRLLTVMERRLHVHPYLAGEVYSIADISAYPWTLAATTFLGEALSAELARKPAVHRWLESLDARPAVARGMDFMSQVPKEAFVKPSSTVTP